MTPNTADRVALMHAIHEQPDDDLPRLAYADWLEEHGESLRAEFVRVELRLARLPADDPDRRALFDREVELIKAHKDEWFGTWRAGWFTYEMRRGFIEEINARSADAVLPCADWLFGHHALQDLRVCGTWKALRSLLCHPLAGVVARLSLVGDETYGASDFDDAGKLVRGKPLAQRPLVLSLRLHGGGRDFVDDLLASPHVGRVERLSLSGNELGVEGVRRLLDGLDAMPRLATLHLAGRPSPASQGRRIVANVGVAGVLALANHPAVAQIRELDLRRNPIDDEGARGLAQSPFLRDLRELRTERPTGRDGAQALQRRFGKRLKLPER